MEIKKGDYVRVIKDGIGIHTFSPMAKVIRINKTKGYVFVDFGVERVYRYRLEQVELIGE
ncbi:hypothetical protein QF028_004397 [Neobacillus sp. B4I6]|uniref:hypothetical protein n=1 Tax=Neobacillus sp. B4I6 TaxID=3373925 RepID=UPI003D1DAEF4